jgi:hypothetical protein
MGRRREHLIQHGGITGWNERKGGCQFRLLTPIGLSDRAESEEIRTQSKAMKPEITIVEDCAAPS